MDAFDVVRMYDPEVVMHCSDKQISDYARERDMALLCLPPEAKPIIFRCRALTREQVRRVRGFSSEGDQNDLAFRYGLIDVRDHPALGAFVVKREKDSLPMNDDALDALGVGEPDIQEIGAVIRGKSFLALGLPLYLRPLASSLLACQAALSLCAERKRAAEMQQAEQSA